MKTLVKALVGLVLVAALALGVGSWFVTQKSGELAQDTVTSLTGSTELGELAAKVMAGQDLTDSEIQSALGLDSATYEKVKSAAADAGIDVNDSSQLRDIAVKNADKADDVESIVSQVQSGELSEHEAADELEGLIER